MSEVKCATKRPYDRVDAKKNQGRQNILLKGDDVTKDIINCKKNDHISLKKNKGDGVFFDVEKITGLKIQQGKSFYKVRWKGYDEGDDSWEPEDNLVNVKDLIEEYMTNKVEYEDDNGRGAISTKARAVGGYEYVPSNELVACKTKYFDDVRDGKIDLTKNDLYSRVKTRCRLKSEAIDPVADDGNPAPSDVCSPLSSTPSSYVKNKYYQSNLFEITAEFMKNNNFDKCLTSMNDDISSLNCSISPNSDHLDDLGFQLSQVQHHSESNCPRKSVETQTESAKVYKKMVESAETEDVAEQSSRKVVAEVNDCCCIHDHDNVSVDNDAHLWNMYAKEMRSSKGGAVVLPLAYKESKLVSVGSLKDLRGTILSNKHSLLNRALKSGATFDWEGLVSPENVTPLQLAASKNRSHIVQLLLRYGAAPDGACSDEPSESALMVASGGGHVHVVRALLDHSARTDRRGHGGKTALCVALEHGRADVVRLLLQHGTNFLEVAPRMSATSLIRDLLMSRRLDRPLCMDLLALLDRYQRAFMDSLNRTVTRHLARQGSRQSRVIFPPQWLSVLERSLDLDFSLDDDTLVDLGTPVLFLVHALQADCSFDFWLDNGCCCVNSVFVNDGCQSSLSSAYFVSTLWPLKAGSNRLSVRFTEPSLLSREHTQIRVALVALGITSTDSRNSSQSRQYH